MQKNTDIPGIKSLVEVMRRLRDPETGCPWDKVQTFETIAPYTIEEAYEVSEAVNRGNMGELKEELGDLLLQVVFHARMAEEAGDFNFNDVAQGIADKMISRHPHIFADGSANTPDDVIGLWDDIKDKEKAGNDRESILDDVAIALPAIMRAQKLQKRAARVGFEWEKWQDVLTKMAEETEELHQAVGSNDAKEVHNEVGDLLFCVVNLGRMLGVDCELALRDCNNKFKRRFMGIEKEIKAKNKDFQDFSLDELEALWQAQKKKERAA